MSSVDPKNFVIVKQKGEPFCDYRVLRRGVGVAWITIKRRMGKKAKISDVPSQVAFLKFYGDYKLTLPERRYVLEQVEKKFDTYIYIITEVFPGE